MASARAWSPGTSAAQAWTSEGQRFAVIMTRLRGISPRRHSHIEPTDIGPLDGSPRTLVEFTHPLCADCREWERRLAAGPDPFVTLDVRARPDLARKYGIAVVPTVFAVSADGAVLERLAP